MSVHPLCCRQSHLNCHTSPHTRGISDEELLGMYFVRISRGTTLLLSIGPDKHGLIPDKYVGALQRCRVNLDKLGL